MTFRFIFELSSYLIGGLSIFLLGMKHMSEGMQAVAGDRLRTLISAVTDNRLSACGVGMSVTCLIQSSSVTTVMVVGLVNAGFMTLQQSIGVILGADIGTTITAWIVAMNILEMGLPILGISGFFFLFSSNERVRYTAMMFMGLGMVFFGLLLMKNGVKPLRTMPEFREWFGRFRPETFLGVMRCVLVGAALTAIVQSSSATVGITMVLASEGTIPFDTALALVVGENLGTTITAYLASLGASTTAKRAAYAHILVKFVGALWVVPVLPFAMRGLTRLLGSDPGMATVVDGQTVYPLAMRGIAIFHTIFNVTNVVLFLPLVSLLARGLKSVFPDKAAKEVPHLSYLDVRMLETPAIGMQESHNEIVRMSQSVDKMIVYLGDVLRDDNRTEEKQKKIFHREEVLDAVQKEITEFLSKLLSGSVSHELMDEGRMHLRMIDEYESISDYVAGVLKQHLKLRAANLGYTPAGKAELLDLHDQVASYVGMISEAVGTQYREIVTKARSQGDMITHLVRECRNRHLTRFAGEEITPVMSLAFTDMLTAYRRIKDHALNVAEALAGQK